MKYYLKHPKNNKWLKLTALVFTQEGFDTFFTLVKNLPATTKKSKFLKNVDSYLPLLESFKVDKNQIPKNTNPYNSNNKVATRENYVYVIYQQSYEKKTETQAYEKTYFDNYFKTMNQMMPFFKGMYQEMKALNSHSETFRVLNYQLMYLLNYNSWIDNHPWENFLEEDSIENRLIKAENYVLAYGNGYLSVDNHPNAHLSNAKIFTSLESATLAKKKIDSRLMNNQTSPAIVKIDINFNQVVLGMNTAVEIASAHLEKQRLEDLLNKVDIKELKAKLAEYEQKMGLENSNQVASKKQKI